MKSLSYANRGRAFEDFLRISHEQYQRAGIACIHKVPTEFLPIRDANGRVVSCKVEEKSCVDYLGRYGKIPVAVEAKHTEEERIDFSRVEPHQAKYMDDFCGTGLKDGVGIIIVSFGMYRFFAVPWIFWKTARDAWMVKGDGSKARRITVEAYGWSWQTPGTASVSIKQLHPEWEIHTGGGTVLPYLHIIDKFEKGESECCQTKTKYSKDSTKSQHPQNSALL